MDENDNKLLKNSIEKRIQKNNEVISYLKGYCQLLTYLKDNKLTERSGLKELLQEITQSYQDKPASGKNEE